MPTGSCVMVSGGGGSVCPCVRKNSENMGIELSVWHYDRMAAVLC